MNELEALKQSGELETFDPERHRLKIAAIDFGIEEAKRIKDWPTLEEAVEIKTKENRKFVAWWKVEVRRAGKYES